MPAFEHSLRLPIIASSVSASGALLGSVPSVHVVNGDTGKLCFVADKLFKLIETPAVEFSAKFATSFHALPDVLQVFEHNHTTSGDRGDNLFCNAVIHVTTKAVLLLRDFAKVSFRRFRALGLQLLPKPVVAIGDPENVAVVKGVVGTDSNLVHTTVDSENIRVITNLHIWNVFLPDDAKKKSLSGFDQFGLAPAPGKVLFEPIWEVESAFDTTIDGQDGGFLPVEPDIEGVGSKTDRNPLRLRALPVFLDSRFQRLCRLHSCLAGKVRRKAKLFTAKLVRLVMQGHRVEVPVYVTSFANVVECLSDRLEGVIQGVNRKL